VCVCVYSCKYQCEREEKLIDSVALVVACHDPSPLLSETDTDMFIQGKEIFGAASSAEVQKFL